MNVLTIKNKHVSMGISTAGGRIVSFKVNDQESLVQEGIQVGSTFWPAPQELWGWPPPVVLDEQEYAVIEHSESRIVLESKVDTSLNVQIQKILTCKGDGIDVTYQMLNTSDRPSKMAAWEITRLDGGVTFYESECELASQSTCEIEQKKGHQWYDYQPDLLFHEVPKIFANGSSGWLANANNGLLLIKQFEAIAKQDVAPGESEIEIYAHEDGLNPYIEIEQQSAFVQLQPNASFQWSVLWTLTEINADVNVKTGCQTLIDAVHANLKL